MQKHLYIYFFCNLHRLSLKSCYNSPIKLGPILKFHITIIKSLDIDTMYEDSHSNERENEFAFEFQNSNEREWCAPLHAN